MFVGLFAYLYHDFMDFLVFELDRVSQSLKCVGEFGIQYLVKQKLHSLMSFVKSKDFLSITEFDDLILLQTINDIFCLDVVHKEFVSFH